MLEIKNLTANLGDFSLKNIDLRVKDDEYFVILGPTGAGKTILLEVIAGMYSVDKGSIILNDQDITKNPTRDRPVSMVYQDYMLFPHMTVEENIRFGLESESYPEEKISKRVTEFIDLLGISNILHRYPRTLSGGERQSVTLARSLVMDPEVLLLDEPISALDVPFQEKIMKELKKIHNETNVTTIHVTHNREEAIRLGDRIGIINNGKIVQTGKSTQVFKKPNSEFVAKFVGTENILEGKSTVSNGTAKVKINNKEIEAVSGKEGKVKVCIRPDEIMVSKKPIKTSGRNRLKGKIVGLSERENIIRLEIDAGIKLIATITKKSCFDMGLRIGEDVHLAFEATAVHLIQ